MRRSKVIIGLGALAAAAALLVLAGAFAGTDASSPRDPALGGLSAPGGEQGAAEVSGDALQTDAEPGRSTAGSDSEAGTDARPGGAANPAPSATSPGGMPVAPKQPSAPDGQDAPAPDGPDADDTQSACPRTKAPETDHPGG